MSNYILYDLNARDSFVSTSESMMLDNEKCVVQEAYRLITTSPGEIPYFRDYGLDVKRFLQYPLTEETASAIYNYVKGQVNYYVAGGEIVQADVDLDRESGIFKFNFYLKIKSTNSIVRLNTWSVQV